MSITIKPELLAPCGSPEALRAAVINGADAVYLSGEAFGMRSASRNFTVEEIYRAAELLHSRGKKLYITVNVLPHVDVYLRCLIICGNVNSSLCVVIVYRVGISCSKIGKIAVLFLLLCFFWQFISCCCVHVPFSKFILRLNYLKIYDFI